MKRLLPVVVLSSAALLALVVQPGRSGDNVSSDSDSAVALNFQPEEQSPARRRVRLPNNYAQLGLSEAQRQRIYALQLEYGEKIDRLEAQLAALREKRHQECEAVLTDAQKKKLAELRKEREKARARKKPAAPQ